MADTGAQPMGLRRRWNRGADGSRMSVVQSDVLSWWSAAFGWRHSRRAATLEGVNDAQECATSRTREEWSCCDVVRLVLVHGVLCRFDVEQGADVRQVLGPRAIGEKSVMRDAVKARG